MAFRMPSLIPFLATLLLGTLARAQEPAAERTLPGAWTLNAGLGAGGASSSGYGEFLEKPQNFEVNIAKGRGAWRFGGGLQFGSMAMKTPYQDELEWARLASASSASTRAASCSGSRSPRTSSRA